MDVTVVLDGIIVALLVSGIAVVGWAGRRVLARIDHTSEAVEAIDRRLVAVETNQGWTMDTLQVTDRNTRKAARKVGVLPRDLENTVQRPEAAS